jgi:hypothetical protein
MPEETWNLSGEHTQLFLFADAAFPAMRNTEALAARSTAPKNAPPLALAGRFIWRRERIAVYGHNVYVVLNPKGQPVKVCRLAKHAARFSRKLNSAAGLPSFKPPRPISRSSWPFKKSTPGHSDSFPHKR